MAMNKKEQAEMQALRDKLTLVSTLRWTEAVARDLPPPSTARNEPDTSGFDFNLYTQDVYQAWSSSISHGTGPARKFSASQNARTLFSNKLLALKALRHALENKAAKELAKVDAMIAAEQEGAKP